MNTVLVIAVVVIAIAAVAAAGYLAILVDEGRKIAAALADEVDDAVELLEAAARVCDEWVTAGDLVEVSGLANAIQDLEEVIGRERSEA